MCKVTTKNSQFFLLLKTLNRHLWIEAKHTRQCRQLFAFTFLLLLPKCARKAYQLLSQKGLKITCKKLEINLSAFEVVMWHATCHSKIQIFIFYFCLCLCSSAQIEINYFDEEHAEQKDELNCIDLRVEKVKFPINLFLQQILLIQIYVQTHLQYL